MLDSSKMVSNEESGGLTIEANEVRTTSLIVGCHNGEGEINEKSLIRAGSSFDRVRTSRRLGLLGLDADGTLVNHRVLVDISKLGDTINGLVSIIQILIAGMAQTLVS